MGEVELLRVPEQGGVARVPRHHHHDGQAAARARAVGTVERDQQVRNHARARAAAVLHARADRLDGGPLLRVVDDDRLPLPDRERAHRGRERVEPGAGPRVRHDRRLRRGRAPPAHARRALLHGPVGRGEAPRPTATTVCASSPASPTSTHKKPSGWKIYEVKGWNLAEALQYEPVVVDAKGGTSSKCFGTAAPASTQHDPELAPWECAAAPWWMNGEQDRPFAADGPSNWARAPSVAAAEEITPRPLPNVTVGPVEERVDSDVVPRLACRRPRRGEDVVLPELERARCAADRGGSLPT